VAVLCNACIMMLRSGIRSALSASLDTFPFDAACAPAAPAIARATSDLGTAASPW